MLKMNIINGEEIYSFYVGTFNDRVTWIPEIVFDLIISNDMDINALDSHIVKSILDEWMRMKYFKHGILENVQDSRTKKLRRDQIKTEKVYPPDEAKQKDLNKP